MNKILFSILAIFSVISISNCAEQDIWNNGRDPVYLLELDKYPKFRCSAELKNGKKLNFVSVKSMMNFYYQPRKYPLYGVKSSDEISRMFVTDYLDGEQVDASRAWYVFGSRVIGPHGDDLIPLSSETKAKLFTDKYGGTKIMNYETLRKKGFGLIRYLDM
jgi:nitrous oxide reductase accessory protein NosL